LKLGRQERPALGRKLTGKRDPQVEDSRSSRSRSVVITAF
jgi:hypothetical protein